MVSLSLPGYPTPLDSRVVRDFLWFEGGLTAHMIHQIASTKEFKDDFPFNLDQNSGKPIGISQSTPFFQTGLKVTSDM